MGWWQSVKAFIRVFLGERSCSAAQTDKLGKKLQRPAHNKRQAQNAPPVLSRRMIIRAVETSLLQRWSVQAFYTGWITSEEEAQKAAAYLPLFYVWGQERHLDGSRFVFSTNGSLISAHLALYLSPDNPRFTTLKRDIQQELHQVAFEALCEECKALDLTPLDILEPYEKPASLSR